MKINNWKKFNELRHSTYNSAARKLDKMGHKKRAQTLRSHSSDMMGKEAFEKYGIGKCSFNLKGDSIIGEFLGFDWGSTYDMYIDNETKFLEIPLFFRFEGKTDGYGNEQMNVFSISYNTADSNIEILSMNEEDLEEVFGVSVLLFDSRKDAMKIYSVLKSINIDEEFSRFIEGGKGMTGEELDQFKKHYKELLSKISISQMWRGK